MCYRFIPLLNSRSFSALGILNTLITVPYQQQQQHTFHIHVHLLYKAMPMLTVVEAEANLVPVELKARAAKGES